MHRQGEGDPSSRLVPIVLGVIPRTSVPPALLRRAENQAWVLSRKQANQGGLSDRVLSRLIRHDWFQLAPGVYSLRPEPTWLGWSWAGVLLAGPESCLGLAAAAHLHRLMPAPDRFAIWTPNRQVRSREPWVFSRCARDAVGSPPRTTLVRTVLDLAAVQPTDALVNLLAAAVGRGTSAATIQAALEHLPRHPRRRLLTELLADVGGGVRSPLERHYLHRVERAHGLPRALRQESPAGAYATDAWYAEFETVVELDGRTWHEGPARFRDQARDNRHAEAGLSTLRFGWSDTLDRPCSMARRIATVLTHNGWQGKPQDCPRCTGRRWL